MTDIAATVPTVLIDGPPVVPYSYGLFSVPLTPPPPGTEWESYGVRWRMEHGGVVAVIYDPCVDESAEPADHDWDDCAQTWGGALPFTVQAAAGGIGKGVDATQVATDNLIAGEQYAVEGQLWTRLVADAAGVPAVVAAGSPAEALATVEANIAAVYGGTAVIHVGRADATRLLANGLVKDKSGRLVTGLGSYVVAGGGYTDGHIIATGPLTVARTAIQNVGGTGTRDLSKNNASALVQRTHLTGWDAVQQRASTT